MKKVCLLFVSIFCWQSFSLNIQQLVDSAKPFDIVSVPYGYYKEGEILIDKPLILKGIDFPVIDGQGKGSVIRIVAPYVTVDGFKIVNSGYSEITEYAGVKIENVERCIIYKNEFENNIYSVFVSKSKDCLISDNVIRANSKYEASSGNGVHLWNCRNINVKNNTIYGHRDGIYIEFTTDSVISQNVSQNNIRYGLHFMYSHRNRYMKNTFLNNQTGVAVMYSKNIYMIENNFQKSWGRTAYGLLLKDISDSYIGFNNFKGNTVGIVFDAASRNVFVNNSIKNNGWALNILGNSESNIFKKNIFIANFFDAMTNAGKSTNIFWGNFWATCKGYDLNYDGISDVPYRPMKIFSRWVGQHPELTVLLGSSVVEFLEVAERVFPVLTPATFMDAAPLMGDKKWIR